MMAVICAAAPATLEWTYEMNPRLSWLLAAFRWLAQMKPIVTSSALLSAIFAVICWLRFLEGVAAHFDRRRFVAGKARLCRACFTAWACTLVLIPWRHVSREPISPFELVLACGIAIGVAVFYVWLLVLFIYAEHLLRVAIENAQERGDLGLRR